MRSLLGGDRLSSCGSRMLLPLSQRPGLVLETEPRPCAQFGRSLLMSFGIEYTDSTEYSVCLF